MSESFDYGRRNPPSGEDHRRAVQAMIASREFWGMGKDEAAQRAYETALSYYIRAGIDPAWFADGGVSQVDVEDVAVSRGLMTSETSVDGRRYTVMTETLFVDPDTESVIVATTDSLTRARR